MRSTLAIYITLSAVAVVAVAQILYWRLVIARDPVRAEDTRDATGLPDALVAWPELSLEAAELRLAAETLAAETLAADSLAAETPSSGERVLAAA